jgi:hypothetical protein
MLYDVQRMFKAGRKLFIDEVRAIAPVTGQLTIGTIQRTQGGPPVRMATLSGGEYNGALLPSLDDCIVAKFNKEGEMLLIGIEMVIRKPTYNGQNDTYPQQWLCKPVDTKIVRRPPSASAWQRTKPRADHPALRAVAAIRQRCKSSCVFSRCASSVIHCMLPGTSGPPAHSGSM